MAETVMAGGPAAATTLSERTNARVLTALRDDKQESLRLAVRARWVALAVIAVLLVYTNPRWDVLYFHAILVGFALIGWAQLKVGRVGHSRVELLVLFCDLALLTYTLVAPNPLQDQSWPAAMKFRFDNFIYFFVLLAGISLAYHWRTMIAVGVWTTGLWAAGVAWALLQPERLAEVAPALHQALPGQPFLADYLDPNAIRIPNRVQEIVVFLIVVATLGLGGRRTHALLLRQAEAARERANLARYFPPTIVDRLAGLDQPLGTVREQDVAVLFADIAGFTKLAEHQSPAQVIGMLREFHALMEQAVFDNAGTLDKFMGDGLMATFGTPQPGPEDAANALRCARNMLAAVEAWNRERVRQGAPPVRLSVGVHQGPVVLGDIGSERRLEFAVIGDVVNVASRLESLTRELDVALVASDALVSAVSEATGADALAGLVARGPRPLRGRDDAVAVWTLQ